MAEYKKECRICYRNLSDVFPLGMLHPSEFVKPEESWSDQQPLTLAKCTNCGLVQLRHEVSLDSMYRQYWYRSGLNKSMIRDLEDVVKELEKRVDLADNDVVIDIGCNDATLFKFYTNKTLFKIGYDPALNLAKEAKKYCHIFINDYFSAEPNHQLPHNFKAKVITAIAMFYDLPDPNWFLDQIKKILHPAGIFVVQFTDLYSMLKTNAFDNICHEHLEYYSLATLGYLMQQNGLEIFHIEYNKVNGGSIRAYIRWEDQKYTINDSVAVALEEERTYMSSFIDGPIPAFIERVEKAKYLVNEFLYQTIISGHEVHALGASTKGNTLLQYFEISSSKIQFAAEINPDKFGLKTVGSDISIISEEDSLAMNPDVYLVLPWHFRDFLESLSHIQNYLNNGGILLYPLPEPQINTSTGVFKLEDYIKEKKANGYY